MDQSSALLDFAMMSPPVIRWFPRHRSNFAESAYMSWRYRVMHRYFTSYNKYDSSDNVVTSIFELPL